MMCSAIFRWNGCWGLSRRKALWQKALQLQCKLKRTDSNNGFASSHFFAQSYVLQRNRTACITIMSTSKPMLLGDAWLAHLHDKF
jgi:hypothetical protein